MCLRACYVRTCVRVLRGKLLLTRRDIASLVIFMAFLLSSLCVVNGNGIRFIIGLSVYIFSSSSILTEGEKEERGARRPLNYRNLSVSFRSCALGKRAEQCERD